MNDAGDGTNYSVEDETLTVQYQEYQFVPNTKSVLIKCRKASKKVAADLGLKIAGFDYVSERNELLGITSCLAFGEIQTVEPENS